MNTKKTQLNTCNCCEGIELRTPQSIHNDPGLSELLFRIGRHSTFKESMLQRLSEALQLGDLNPLKEEEYNTLLRELNSREDDDHTIALLDAWAMVLDVLTFYQERIANEGYIRTSRERLSLVELSRHISYIPKPGVAAGTWFSFMLDESPGAPTDVEIPVGTKVQSIPGQDEKPQVFETIEQITGRTQWNKILPRLSEAQTLIKGSTSLYLEGTDSKLQKGDTILIVGKERLSDPGSERWDIRILESVEPDDDNNRTLISWRLGLGHTNPLVYPGSQAKVYAFRQIAAVFGQNAPDPRSFIDDVYDNYSSEIETDASDNILDWDRSEVINNTNGTVFLDADYPKVLTDSWLVFFNADYAELYQVDKIESSSKKAYTLAKKASKVTLDTTENLDEFDFRDTVVFAQSEELPLTEAPLFSPVFGKEIYLDNSQPDLVEEQNLIITGEPVKQVQVAELTTFVKSGSTEVEVTVSLNFISQTNAVIPLVSGEILDVISPPEPLSANEMRWYVTRGSTEGHVDVEGEYLLPYSPPSEDNGLEPPTSLNQPELVSERISIQEIPATDHIILDESLEHVYFRHTVKINGNVAQATHGETRVEVLGSGDGTQLFQQFYLKQKPLTYIASTAASGSESTLEIRVNDILWKESRTFYGQSARERLFVTHQEDDGTVRVQFGNGKTGARLPSGSENVRAVYRMGTGFDGLLKADQLSMLMSPQLGLKSVTNPLATSGADEPESPENIRENAPLTVLTLDRVVSVQDFEDFAAAFAGIGKARADLLWKGEDRTVHLTVASASEGSIDDTLEENLTNAINGARHNNYPVEINSFEEILFNIVARVKIHKDYPEEKVLPAVGDALKKNFDFSSRKFGQDVTPSEVIAIIQSIDGVLAVDLEELGGQDPFSAEHFRLISNIARWESDLIKPADLLLVDPDQIEISSMDE